MTAIDTTTTVGQLVRDNPARSRLFEKLGIDYCCGGKRPLAEVCAEKGLDADTLVAVLQAADAQTGPEAVHADAMRLAELCDHIEATHHAYLRAELPRLAGMLRKLAGKHGQALPWLVELEQVFLGLREEMLSHMGKEECVLFPMIRDSEAQGVVSAGPCGSIEMPIHVMEQEHAAAGEALARMRQLSSDYTAPADACGTFRAALDGLRQLEADMHQHVHKENNVLFPKAMALRRA